MSRTTARLGTFAKLIAIVSGSALLFSPQADAASVSQSTASAFDVAALSVPLLPIAAAQNDGSQPTVTSTGDGAIPLLPGETLSNTGLYAQTAIASDDGSSAACAGVVGSGSTLSLGQDGTCDPTTTTGPAIINFPGFTVLGTGFSFKLQYSRLYSVCTAGPSDSSSGFSAQSVLGSVSLIAQSTVLGVPGPSISIPISVSTPISIPAPFNSVVSIDVNQTDATGPVTSATAFHIGLGPNSSLFSMDIGKVTCGGNAITADTPVLPAKGLWVAGGTVSVIGGVWFVRRRRSATALIGTA
jgi:hypothetical protein